MQGKGGGSAAGSVILGVSCDYHDAAAALVIDGVLVAAAEEERFSRIKHDPALPADAIDACLDLGGVGAADVDRIAFYEKPLTVISRYLASRQHQGPRSIPAFVRDMPPLLSKNLMVGYRLRRHLADRGAAKPPAVEYVEHHQSHASAAFNLSPFDEAAIVTLDGIGEWATATLGVGEPHGITLIDELRYPHSLGLVYSFITRWCGFQPNDGEYKVMGLAPYGEPTRLEALRELVRVDGQGGLDVDVRALGWYSAQADRSPRLIELLGGPRRSPDEPLEQRHADLAASVQVLVEEAVLAMATRAHELTGKDHLCMAGGVALNCVANGRVLREGPFTDLWVQPAAGDAGSAAGAALALWHQDPGQPHRPTGGDGMSGACLGPAVTSEAAATILDERGVAHRRITDPEALASEVAGVIADGGVVGRFAGRAEFGPRALGHRSILADPRDATIRSRLNLQVKGRESFRPFAPAVLAEHAGEWFELDHPSPYMLIVAPVRAEHRLAVDEEPEGFEARGAVPRSTIPACTHVDGSARVQTVDRAVDPELHRLISAFHERTGVPMVVNTSFNLAGEPIVATVHDALRTAKAGSMDLLVIEDLLVDRAALEGLDG